MDKNGIKSEDSNKASSIIAIVSIAGLTTCFLASLYFKKEIPLILYAIFGGGILGTDNVLKFIKAIFRINDNGK